MALSIRQKVFFFAGLNIAMYGLALIILGAWSTQYFIHGASGASMFCGIFLIMCGVWDIVMAIDQDPTQEIAGLSLSGLIVNMGAVFLGIAVIGFATWAAMDFLERGVVYGILGTERQIELYVTILLLGVFSFVLGLLALMVDCCCSAFNDADIAAAPLTAPPGGLPGGLPYGIANGAINGGAYPYPQQY